MSSALLRASTTALVILGAGSGEALAADQIPEDLQPGFPSEAALARTLAPGAYEVAIADAASRRLVGGSTVRKRDAEAGSCPLAGTACYSVTVSGDGTTATCVLPTSACAVDLATVVEEVALDADVTAATPFWVQAWGGIGAAAKEGAKGGSAGYAQTTTSLTDILDDFDGVSALYYFIGDTGAYAGETCGGPGGAATIVTLEDLSANPTQGPDSEKILLVAGAGGGGGGHDPKGFCGNTFEDGGEGGVAIALDNNSVTGAGTPNPGVEDDVSCETQGGDAQGGTGCQSASGDFLPGDGLDGFGGMGLIGGDGADCRYSTIAQTPFLNAPTLAFTAGQAGKGGGGEASCVAGGGGGGGGYGGGGRGGHGNTSYSSLGGGGGGSYARFATRESSLAPTKRPSNECADRNNSGCVQVVFDLTQ